MRALGALALVTSLALSACDGGDVTQDDGAPMRGDTGTPPATNDGAPTDHGPPVLQPGQCSGFIAQLIGSGMSKSTIAAVDYICYSCAGANEPPPEGCFADRGGPRPVLCVSDYAAAGCR